MRRLEIPAGPGVRWDGGVAEGFEVGLHYDPLLGKLIVHAPSRAAAIRRMERALDELVVIGVETSAPFHRRVMAEPDFRDGRLSIRFLEDHPELTEGRDDEEALVAAAVAATLLEHERRRARMPDRRAQPGAAGAGGSNRLSAWRAAGWPWVGGGRAGGVR